MVLIAQGLRYLLGLSPKTKYITTRGAHGCLLKQNMIVRTKVYIREGRKGYYDCQPS